MNARSALRRKLKAQGIPLKRGYDKNGYFEICKCCQDDEDARLRELGLFRCSDCGEVHPLEDEK